MLSRLKALFKGKSKKSKLELSKDKLEALEKFRTEFIQPALEAFSKLVKILVNPGYVKFGNESNFSKCVNCLSAYDSAIEQIMNEKVKTYAEAKMYLKLPTYVMACEFLAGERLANKFQAVASEIGTVIGQIPLRIRLGLDEFFKPFNRFFDEFLKKEDEEDALKYYNENFEKVKRKAESVLNYVWGNELRCELKPEKFKSFKYIWNGPEMIPETTDGSEFLIIKFKIEDAKSEIESLSGKVDTMVQKLNKSFGPEILSKKYMKVVGKLFGKLDEIK